MPKTASARIIITVIPILTLFFDIEISFINTHRCVNYSPINKFSAANAKTELFIKINSVILSVYINSFCPGFNRFGNNSVNYRCPVMLASIFFKHCNSAYFKPV